MRLQTKLILALGTVLFLGLGLAGFSSYQEVKKQKIAQIRAQAEIVTGMMMATRRVYQKVFLESGLSVDEKSLPFLPAHAMSRISDDFPNWVSSGLTFNNVSDRPRNPRNQADEMELEAMAWFRAHPDEENRLVAAKDKDGKAIYHYSTPIWIEPYCLKCHGDPEDAPPVIRENYTESYGYQLGDLRGLFSVKIPEMEINLAATQQFYRQLLWQMLVVLLAFAFGILMIRRLVVKRLADIESATSRFSTGDYSVRAPINHHDEITAVSLAFNDMAQQCQFDALRQKEKEQQIRDLLDSIAEGVYGVDLDGRCMFANPACADFLGYESPSQLIGENIHALMHHTKADGTPHKPDECLVYQCLRQGRAQRNAEDLFWRRDGRSFPAEFSARPMYRQEHIVGAVVAFSDISERKQTEENLRQAQKMQAIGQLTGGIAHDFNNVLAILLGNLDLLGDLVEGNPKAKERVENATQVAWRAANLTKQLLQFARREPRNISQVDLNQVLLSMDDLIDRSLTPEIELKLCLAPDLWLTQADEGDLRDAILNLVLNARDAMPAGGCITLTTANLSEADAHLELGLPGKLGRFIHLQVRDTGIGMDQALLSRVFEPFFTTKERGKGTGLGMAMVYAFVQRSEGSIHIESEPGMGTSIDLYLPAADKGEAVSQPEKPEQQSAAVSFKGDVLLVDDEEQLLDLGKLMLTLLGLNVVTALSPKQAIIELGSGHFDLLMTDMIMPGGMGGDELAMRAREMQPDIALLFATGYVDEDVFAEVRRRWNANVLAKPYSRLDLIGALEELLPHGHA